MTLTIPSLQELKKVSVLVVCPGDDNNRGSGTIISVDGMLYVLTAAHVVSKKDKTHHAEENINVSAIKDDEAYKFTVKTVAHYDLDKDCAVLIVVNDNSYPEEPLARVRILNQIPTGNGMLCGFGSESQEVKIYPFGQVSDTTWSLNKGLDVTQQPISAKENWGGFSGGGIFYKGESELFLAAYMKGLCDIEGNNNEFLCFPATYFAVYDPIKKIVLDIPVDYTQDDALRNVSKGENFFKPLCDSTLTENHESRFINSSELDTIIKKLRSDDRRTILLTALSGLGKTRLIYEAFKNKLQSPRRYYCKYYDGGSLLLSELERLLNNNVGSEGVIIIDDCPIELLENVILYRDKFNPNFRIIATNNDFFNIEEKPFYELIPLQPSDIRSDVNQFIEDSLHPNDSNRASVEEIKHLSDGFPQMANALIEEFEKGKGVSVDVVRDLMPKLLKFDANQVRQDCQKKIMQTLSLCLPLPYTGNQRETFKFILTNQLFTPLNGMEWTERRSMAEELVAKYKPTLIDVQSEWLYVRPFPLAVWLTSEWFDKVCNSNQHFKDLIESILEQPEYMQKTISEGFCKHIEQMYGNKSAYSLVAKLVDANCRDPFFDEEVLTSGLGSKFFLAMSSVNPEAAAQCLATVFLKKEVGWLREKLTGTARRNIVWALEKLCFAKESYREASKVMARLAVAENEDIGNNATGQIKQLFHLFLAGTEVDLNERINTLEYLLSMGPDYASLAVGCCNHSFMSRDFNKICGAEKFGFTRREEYQPKTYSEINDYWKRTLALLLKAIDTDPTKVGFVANLIEENTFQWVRENRWDILAPLMESIAVCYNNDWEKEYDALIRVKNVVKEELHPASLEKLNIWLARIKPKTFITDLKDARQQLWGNYKLKDADMLQYSKDLFEPLAKRFINDGIYKDGNEVDLILTDKDYIDNVFSKKLVELMSETDLNDFFGLIFDLILKKEESFNSPFLLNICSAAVDSIAYTEFLERLRKNGRLLLYYNLMAFTEQDDLRHFAHLCTLRDKGELPDDFLTYYLNGARALNKIAYDKIIVEVHRVFPDKNNELVHFVLSHRFFLSNEELCNEIVKQAVLGYEFDERGASYDYYRLLADLLEQQHDAVFAKAVNHKLIEAYNKHLGFHNSDGVFPVLLRKYTDDIWDDFMSAFLSPDYFLFYYQVKDELGSGFGFGRGPLFEVKGEKLQELCFSYPDVAPLRLAAMVPCFDNDADDHFSEWFVWLLDNFGDKNDVLDALHANLGSYYWTGSTIPYYKRNISAFEKLLDHKLPEVKDWAERCLKDENTLLKAEISNEDFMRIRHDM